MTTQETSGPLVRKMFSAIAARYDFANHFLSFGWDLFWRRRAARIVRAWQPAHVLDLATGSGDLALSLRAACRAETHSMFLRVAGQFLAIVETP